MKKAYGLLGIGVFAGVAAFAACSSHNNGNGNGNGGGNTPLTGAVWTTMPDGSTVNSNIYERCEDVYINGGPRGGGPGLPDGQYVFQVTDPSGKVVLSSDTMTQRGVITSSGGEFTSYQGDHEQGTDTDDGGVVVQLWPFNATPNPGGEYKVWVTPLSDFNANGGFLPRDTKTDNFKCGRVEDAGPPPDAQPDVQPDAVPDAVPDAPVEDVAPPPDAPPPVDGGVTPPPPEEDGGVTPPPRPPQEDAGQEPEPEPPEGEGEGEEGDGL